MEVKTFAMYPFDGKVDATLNQITTWKHMFIYMKFPDLFRWAHLHRRSSSAYLGTDAGFYRLIPCDCCSLTNEDEVSCLLALADKHNLPVTFRAAGTSFGTKYQRFDSDRSWQTLGKSILFPKILKQLHSQPGIIGERVNQILKPSVGNLHQILPRSNRSWWVVS